MIENRKILPMNKCRCFFWGIALVVATIFVLADAFQALAGPYYVILKDGRRVEGDQIFYEGDTIVLLWEADGAGGGRDGGRGFKKGEDIRTSLSKPEYNSKKVEGAKRLRWLDPDAEKMWEEYIQDLENVLHRSEMQNVDRTQAEGQLEAFGTLYMANAYAKYQETRARALELEQAVKENFPQGAASDPTGGTMFRKANKNLVLAVAQMHRRRDELCFFLLFHQAGIFSEDVLAKYDSHPISIRLEPESSDWPEDTPKVDTTLSAEDATFSAKYLPETHAGYQRLCGLFEEGAQQYADLRQTALTLDAPRARYELMMLKTRLETILKALHGYQKDFYCLKLEHTFGEKTAENLGEIDQGNAVQIQKFERAMGVKAYIAQAATHLFVPLPGGAKMEMVWCPPGTFMMGSPENEHYHESDETLHQVTLTKGFWMAKTEVTQGQWKSVMEPPPSEHTVSDNLPVENVSWFNAQWFCEKAGLQLPLEAEWEYACRAGSTGPYAGTGKIEEMGWDDHKTHPVGQKAPNAWGLYDMHGNVQEWCADHYEYDLGSGAVTNPLGPDYSSERVIRSGRTSACRNSASPRHGKFTGFRPIVRQE